MFEVTYVVNHESKKYCMVYEDQALPTKEKISWYKHQLQEYGFELSVILFVKSEFEAASFVSHMHKKLLDLEYVRCTKENLVNVRELNTIAFKKKVNENAKAAH